MWGKGFKEELRGVDLNLGSRAELRGCDFGSRV